MLANRWFALCEETGLDGRAGWALLSSAYGDTTRAYHNMNHIRDCLLRLDEYAHLAADPLALELAIWFHDIVYDPRAADNEERSAAVAAQFLADGALGALVADLIRDTKHDSPPRSRDAELLCDIDLAILGRSPNKYDSYARAIREEYAWVPLPQYVETRTRVLQGFLARPSIFVLDEFQERFGEQARANLAREILSLADPLPDCPDPLEPDIASLS